MATYFDTGRAGLRAALSRHALALRAATLGLALLAAALAWLALREANPVAAGDQPQYYNGLPASPSTALGTDRPPRPLAGNPVPSYPRSALRNGSEGDVVVAIIVGSDGRPVDVQVVARGGSEDPAFDRAAMAAARQWRFEPAMRDGQAVPSTVHLPVEFRRE